MKAINGCLVLKGEELKFAIEYIDRLVHIQTGFLTDPEVIQAASSSADKMADWHDVAGKMIRAVNMLNEIAETDVWPKDLPKSKLAWDPTEYGDEFKNMNAEKYWNIAVSAAKKLAHRRAVALKKAKENASSDNK